MCARVTPPVQDPDAQKKAPARTHMEFKNPNKQVWEKAKPCPKQYLERYQKLLEERKNTKSQDLIFSWIMTEQGVEISYTKPTPDQLPLNKHKPNHNRRTSQLQPTKTNENNSQKLPLTSPTNPAQQIAPTTPSTPTVSPLQPLNPGRRQLDTTHHWHAHISDILHNRPRRSKKQP